MKWGRACCVLSMVPGMWLAVSEWELLLASCQSAEDISRASEMWHHHPRDRAAPGSMPEVPLAYLAFSALSRMPPSIRDLRSSFAFDTLTVPKCPLTIRLGALESPEKVWSRFYFS